ncbi:MAG: DNA adenine methylase [Candidatus Thermoplasmatota archaeon]|nr:DNA adenine methylase [Candidatus Thermoplasmatota archaeon]
MKSVFKYYGGKFNQLKDILEVMEGHMGAFDAVVDVFGGSGKVLLNVPDEWKKIKVYNDLDEELYKTFKVLQDSRKRNLLVKKLRVAFLHDLAFRELRDMKFGDDVETAFKVIYTHTFSFMGDGKTFGRIFKGNTKLSRFAIENFIYVRGWVIENRDFRELFRIYNRPRVLMYLDPPYLSSGKAYKHSFKMEDLRDLKACMDNHQGSYLLNLSSFDHGMEEIFGKPDKVIDYANPLNRNGKIRWGCGYWWKFI